MSRAASPPESASVRFVCVLAAEQHLAEQPAQFLLRGLRIEFVEPLDKRYAFADGIGMILRKISDRHFVPPRDRSADRRETPGPAPR